MIIKSDLFIKLISWTMRPTAIALWPFIIYSPKRIIQQVIRERRDYLTVRDVLLNHEQIHLQQQKELFVIGFYVLYLYYFLKYIIKHRSAFAAYRCIPFEQEAYDRQYMFDYLEDRPRNEWKNYVS